MELELNDLGSDSCLKFRSFFLSTEIINAICRSIQREKNVCYETILNFNFTLTSNRAKSENVFFLFHNFNFSTFSAEIFGPKNFWGFNHRWKFCFRQNRKFENLQKNCNCNVAKKCDLPLNVEHVKVGESKQDRIHATLS